VPYQHIHKNLQLDLFHQKHVIKPTKLSQFDNGNDLPIIFTAVHMAISQIEQQLHKLFLSTKIKN